MGKVFVEEETEQSGHGILTPLPQPSPLSSQIPNQIIKKKKKKKFDCSLTLNRIKRRASFLQ